MADDFLMGISERFPSEILKGRMLVEGNVIACLAKDLLLVDDTHLSNEYFITKDGNFYFELIKTIREKNFSSIDDVTILSNMNEEVVEKYTEFGGWDVLQHMIDVINLNNFDTYLDNLYREDTICRLYLDGFNVLKPVINDKGKEFIPLDKFRKMSSEEVLEWYDSRLTTYPTSNNTKIIDDEELELDDGFIQDCKEGIESGVPFAYGWEDINGNSMSCYPALSNQVNGFLPGTLSMLGGYSSVGKSSYITAIFIGLLAQGRKVLIISNEEGIEKYKMRFLLWILYKYNRYYKVTKKKLLSGNLSDEDEKQIKIAQGFWNKNIKGNLKFVSISEVDGNLYKKIIRNNVLRYGYDVAMIDTFKVDFNNMSSQRLDLDLVRDSRMLDTLAKKYNIIVLANIQLSIHTTGQLFLDASVLSNSKQIKEILENLFLMRTVYNAEEFDPKNKYYCKPFQLKHNKELNKWYEEDFEPDPTGIWRMLFVDKTRSGRNSEDDGVAYLLRFDGDHGVFKEQARCRPKHGFITG